MANRDLRLVQGVADRRAWVQVPDENGLLRLEIPYGAVVATARLVTAFRVGEWTADWQYALCDESHSDYCPGSLHVAKIDAYGDFGVGRWLWVLDRVEELATPVEATGHQGLWNWEAPE